MIKEAIEYLQRTAHAQIIEHDGRTYFTKELHSVKPPSIDTVQVHTLDGLFSLCAPLAFNKALTALVKSPTHVVIFGEPQEPWKSRDIYAEARDFERGARAFQFGEYYDQSEFIIGLNSWFVKTSERDKLLQFVSSVTEESGARAVDDGVTQTVTTKRGAKLGLEGMPNPVTLAPYRSFREKSSRSSRDSCCATATAISRCLMSKATHGSMKPSGAWLSTSAASSPALRSSPDRRDHRLLLARSQQDNGLNPASDARCESMPTRVSLRSWLRAPVLLRPPSYLSRQ